MNGRAERPSPHRVESGDVAARAASWDSETAAVVLARLGPASALRFFTTTEETTARALVGRLLGDDAEQEVPVVALLDTRLADGETDGWRYEDMPEDRTAWKQSLNALDMDASQLHAGSGFADLDRRHQIELLERVRTAQHWHGLPAARIWALWMRYVCVAFYSHPWAWHEIGFGGPAYPTGYKNLGVNGRESWEHARPFEADPEPWAARVEASRRRHDGRQLQP